MSTMKLLVGVDGSDASRRALEWCAQHAPRLDADVVVVHAIEQPVVVAPVTTGFVLPEFTPADREAIERTVVDDWCAPLTRAAVPFRVVLKDGGAPLSLMQAANDEDADLVVTGRRGRGGFSELLLGSTSHALSHHLHRPLLIIP
jgi:nucleotide-binding universal stress UspA family protein